MSGNNQDPADVETVATWTFMVQHGPHDEIFVEWTVKSGFGEEAIFDEDGRTSGGLHLAIMDAYDSIGITCPLVPDRDLLWLGGHGPNPREEDE